jgi:uncharacterized protein (DUF305 family)
MLAALAIAMVALPAAAADPNTQFKADNDAAMSRMMAGMMAKPTGDVDRDFAEMMIPHHQGAIEMAEAELRYGKSEQLKRIAQEIIVDQQQEIVAMRLALGDALPPSTAAPTVAAATRSPPTPNTSLPEPRP